MQRVADGAGPALEGTKAEAVLRRQLHDFCVRCVLACYSKSWCSGWKRCAVE